MNIENTLYFMQKLASLLVFEVIEDMPETVESQMKLAADYTLNDPETYGDTVAFRASAIKNAGTTNYDFTVPGTYLYMKSFWGKLEYPYFCSLFCRLTYTISYFLHFFFEST